VSYSIRIDAKRRVVHVVVSDTCDGKEVPRMATFARTAAAARGFNILYDIRDALAHNLETADVFWWPRKLEVLRSVEARRMRTAVLHVPAQRELAQFWETAYRNLGFKASAFEEEAAAFGWLAG
jgi:hypothetical protein